MPRLRAAPLNLTELLRPLAPALNGAYWFLGDPDLSLPARLAPGRPPRNTRTTDPAFQEYYAEYTRRSEAWDQALADYLDTSHHFTVGLPGFFNPFADALAHDWVAYCAADTPQPPYSAFASISSPRWLFNHYDHVPPEICISLRNPDNAYWEIFFRDDWMYQATLAHLRARGADPLTPLP